MSLQPKRSRRSVRKTRYKVVWFCKITTMPNGPRLSGIKFESAVFWKEEDACDWLRLRTGTEPTIRGGDPSDKRHVGTAQEHVGFYVRTGDVTGSATPYRIYGAREAWKGFID